MDDQMTWIKLDDTLPNNPKILPLSDKAFRLYIEGLCYANQYLTDGFLAEAAVIRLDTGNACEELLEAGLWIGSESGIQIHDYCEHQTSRKDVEEKRNQSRERVTRYRTKSNADVTLPETETETETENIYTFEMFWSTYPIKIGKAAAMRAWVRATKRASSQIIIEGVERYKKDPNRDQAFTAHPATWLNGDRWLDAPLPQKRAQEGSRGLITTPTPVPPRYIPADTRDTVAMPDSVKEILNEIRYKA